MSLKFEVTSQDMRVDGLKLHHAANRELQVGRVKKLEAAMDLDALGRFAVWHDEDDYYVIDGQHRKVALENLGLGEWLVRCDVYDNMTFAEACAQFLKLNDGLLVRPWDRFDKSVKAGYEAETETRRIIREAGLVDHHTAKDGRVAAVVAATEVWKLDRGEALARQFQWSREAWGRIAPAVDGQMIRALGLFAFTYNGTIDDDSLVKKLAKFPGGPNALLGRAKAQKEIKGGTVYRNAASIIVDLYNKGRTTRRVAQF